MKFASYLLPLWVAALLVAMPNIGQASPVPVDPYEIEIDGIPAPGYPSFQNAVSITQSRSGTGASATTLLVATHTASGITFRPNANSSYAILNPSFLLSASFDSEGAFISGSVSINGELPGYNGPGIAPPAGLTNLYLANLSDFGFDKVNGKTPVALGFKTDNFSGWAAQFQSGPESVYLYDFNVVGFMNSFKNPKLRTTTFSGSAITTVPVPGAVWLFGSSVGLLLAGLSRRTAVSLA